MRDTCDITQENESLVVVFFFKVILVKEVFKVIFVEVLLYLAVSLLQKTYATLSTNQIPK